MSPIRPIRPVPFSQVRGSLSDLVGDGYVEAVCGARAALTGENESALLEMGRDPLDFLPPEFLMRLEAPLDRVGKRVAPALGASRNGATSAAFERASKPSAAPLSALGWFRVGEDGRLRFIAKSEHYHAPLGHGFPGFGLVETARRLGIPNATHNNTRGHITRLLEERLVEAATAGLEGPPRLERVLNLQTGSLAVEAAFKMCAARFFAHEPGGAARYADRMPVFVVVGDEQGSPAGNYHGTTAFVQTLRGLWPGLAARMADGGIMRVVVVRPNNEADLREAFERWERPPFKVAAFLHEIVMMNYGALLLSPEFLRLAYRLCAAHEVPTVADEIQSCLWAPGLYMFRGYGLKPDLLAVGKGFAGGEFAASRLLFSSKMDGLSQFGALVTNGQEELASLTYLITMRWALANEEPIRRLGDLYAERLRDLVRMHPDRLDGVQGSRHMSALRFHELEQAGEFARTLNDMGLDISAQTYKADCPPVVLTKLPLICTEPAIEFVLRRMEEALA
jgi:acetylornithine/succinyldiaminopimelate/putrescine aminotransferase